MSQIRIIYQNVSNLDYSYYNEIKNNCSSIIHQNEDVTFQNLPKVLRIFSKWIVSKNFFIKIQDI